TVDVGEAQSVVGQDGKITTFDGFLRSGDAETEFRLQIIRLPVVTGGAFTLPAVPIALVYAPPPGSQKKNYAEYSSMNSSSRKIATTVSGGTTTKTSDAYSTSDFIDKISGLASSIQGFLGAFGIVGEDPLKKAGASTILGLNLLSGILSSTTTSTKYGADHDHGARSSNHGYGHDNDGNAGGPGAGSGGPVRVSEEREGRVGHREWRAELQRAGG